jgi:hypothetical protein
VLTRRCAGLDHRDRILWDGIPCTIVARTVVDLAAVLREDHLARAVHEAESRRGMKPSDVEFVLERVPNAKGARVLRRVIHGDVPALLSHMESGFFALLRAERLPLPRTNRRAGAHYVDCRWPEHRLTVELQSYRYHQSRHAWKRDHERRRDARRRGDRFAQYTWDDVFVDPALMLDELRELLGCAP